MESILIVDDEKFVRNLLKEILDKEGYCCTIASDASEARSYLASDKFQLLISDLDMPGEPGLDLIRYALSEYSDLAAIVVTGTEDNTVAQSAIEIGVYDYITKPIERNRVTTSVANSLNRRELKIENRTYRNELEILVEKRTKELKQAISNLEKTQETLRESEHKFRSFLDNSKDAVYMVTIEGNFIWINEAGLELFGYSREDLSTITIRDFYINPSDREGIINFIDQEGAVKDLRVDFKKKDGTPLDVRLTTSCINDEAGNTIGYQGFIRDITSYEQARKSLQESEEKFKNITQFAHDAIIMMDDDGKVSYWNKAAEKIFGYSSQDALGADLHELIAPSSVESFRNGLERFKQTGQGHIVGKTLEVKAVRKDGTEFSAELSLSTLKLRDRWNALGILRDITDRKALESQLIHAQKLESIGQLAAGIAHEINTPTQFVGDNTRFLKDAFADINRLIGKYQTYVSAVKAGKQPTGLLKEIETTADEIDLSYLKEEIPLAINQALEGVERVAKIVRAMKEFSHPGAEEKTPIDINHAIESTITVARNEWKYVAEMETEFDHTLPAVPCLPGDFNQVILNMIVNAAHAIGEAVGDGSAGKGKIRVSTKRNGDFAEIRISDTGAGIPEEIRNRIFDPFFTTKAVGKGTGQGLAIAYSVIVDKHGGQLDFESEPGKGTCFIIRVPVKGVEQDG